jgi:long-subunit acyl-CoA synthetase (AMP-forming)
MPIPNLEIDDVAVILFTSGSESLPKAVPLTHKNLIEDIKGSISIFKVKQDDILL